MEQAEKVIADKSRRLKHRMRMYQVSRLSSGNLDQHVTEIKEREQILEDLISAIEVFIEDYSSELCQEKTNKLKNKISALEQEFIAYTDSFESKLTELKKTPSMNNSALLEASLNSFQSRQNAAKKKVKAKLEAIMEDLEKLRKKATKVDDWSSVTDLAVERAMRENEKLRKEYDRINAARREIAELMAEFDLDEVRDELSVQECDLKLVDVEEDVEDTVKAVEEQNDIRELYSLDDVKVDKIKLPVFSGKDSEDYEKFKSDLLKGFAQNRVTQADKLDKLRECLTGEAKRLVPHLMSSNVDDALNSQGFRPSLWRSYQTL